MKYCEYCNCAAHDEQLKCEQCGAPFTKNSKEVRKLPDMTDWDYGRMKEIAKRKGLKPGRIM